MIRALLRRYDLTFPVIAFLTLLGCFLAFFLVYPLAHVVKGAFVSGGRFTFAFIGFMVTNPSYYEAVLNSANLGLAVTVATTLLSLPIAYVMVRYEFPGRALANGLLLVPMVMPPFVGAIGMKQVFARFGSINQLLLHVGVIHAPVDWLGGGGFWGVVVMEVLHLYPIMYLNVAAALANVDPSLEEAGRNMGASGMRLFRTITFPLMLPGYFAGAIIVFIWAFTDLGTPLIFGLQRVIPVQIYERITDVHENPMGYALVVTVMIVSLLFFYLSKTLIGGRRYEMIARGHVSSAARAASPRTVAAIYILVGSVTLLALLPHMAIVLTSIASKWFMTIVPEAITGRYYSMIFEHKLTLSSIRTSFFLSVMSSILDIVVGIGIAYLLARRVRLPGRNVLDAIAMLPLALPGLVLAFGYLAGFSGTFLDARMNPIPLLAISYAVRRLPYMVRAAYAGFQQTSVTLEEASMNLGAGPGRTFYHITFPLIYANLLAGGILCFSFSMLEVSDSLILALREQYYPITKAIYVLLGRIEDGPYIASAMGVLGMVLLAASLLLAGRFLGRRMGELFRA